MGDYTSVMLFRRNPLLVLLTLVTLCVFGVSGVSGQDNHRGRKYKAPPPTSTVNVTIVRADDGKPIDDAAVIFQLMGDKGNMELKTNEDGKTMIDVLPTGSKVLLQVIAKGYQTYGKQYSIDKATIGIEVKMNRPVREYSIYEKHNNSGSSGSANSGGSSNGGQKDASKPGADSSQQKK